MTEAEVREGMAAKRQQAAEKAAAKESRTLVNKRAEKTESRQAMPPLPESLPQPGEHVMSRSVEAATGELGIHEKRVWDAAKRDMAEPVLKRETFEYGDRKPKVGDRVLYFLSSGLEGQEGQLTPYPADLIRDEGKGRWTMNVHRPGHVKMVRCFFSPEPMTGYWTFMAG